MERLFYCTESGNVYTTADLERLWLESSERGDCPFTDTLEQFIECCSIDFGGTLLELRVEKKLYIGGKLSFVQSNIRSDLF